MNNVPVSIPNAPKENRRAFSALQSFYDKPVAKVSIELIATTIAVIGLSALAIRPTITATSRLLKDIEERRITNQALIKKESALSTVSIEMLRLKPKITKLDAVLPNTVNLEGILKRIEKLASENSVPLSQLQLNTIPRESLSAGALSPQEYPVAISFVAPYANAQKFLTALESMDRSARIRRTAMRLSKDKVSQDIQVNVDLVLFNFGAPLSDNGAPQQSLPLGSPSL